MCYGKRRWERNIEGSTIFDLPYLDFELFDLSSFDLPSLDFELSIFHFWISSFRSSIFSFSSFRSSSFVLRAFDLISFDLPSFDLGLDSESRIGKSTTAISSSGRPVKTGQPKPIRTSSLPSPPLYMRPGPVQEPPPPPCKSGTSWIAHSSLPLTNTTGYL